MPENPYASPKEESTAQNRDRRFLAPLNLRDLAWLLLVLVLCFFWWGSHTIIERDLERMNRRMLEQTLEDARHTMPADQ